MTPEHELIKHLVERAGINVKTSEQLAPVFFVGNEERHTVTIVPAEFSCREDKANAARKIREMVREENADFLLFISESWTIKGTEDAQEYMDNQEKYGYSMSNHPKAAEVLMLTLETKDKTYHALADILPGRNLGEIKWQETKTPDTGGTFSDLLGRKTTMR